MPTTIEDVRATLEPDEPDYGTVAALGSDAIPYLRELVRQGDVSIAAKAAYAASLLGEESIDVLRDAADSEHPEVRVAAAAGAHNIQQATVTDLLIRLVQDADDGVRRMALNAIPSDIPQELRTKLEDISSNDSEVPDVRALAAEAMRESPTIPRPSSDSDAPSSSH